MDRQTDTDIRGHHIALGLYARPLLTKRGGISYNIFDLSVYCPANVLSKYKCSVLVVTRVRTYRWPNQVLPLTPQFE